MSKVFCCNCKYIDEHLLYSNCKKTARTVACETPLRKFYVEVMDNINTKNLNNDCKDFKIKWWKL